MRTKIQPAARTADLPAFMAWKNAWRAGIPPERVVVGEAVEAKVLVGGEEPGSRRGGRIGASAMQKTTSVPSKRTIEDHTTEIRLNKGPEGMKPFGRNSKAGRGGAE